MRKSIFAAAIFAALPLVATAMPHDQKPRPPIERHAPAHDLTREQKRQLFEIKRNTTKERAEIQKRYLGKLPAAEQRAMSNELNALKDKERRAINKVLTPEQQKAAKEREDQRKAQASEWAEFKKWQDERKQR